MKFSFFLVLFVCLINNASWAQKVNEKNKFQFSKKPNRLREIINEKLTKGSVGVELSLVTSERFVRRNGKEVSKLKINKKIINSIKKAQKKNLDIIRFRIPYNREIYVIEAFKVDQESIVVKQSGTKNPTQLKDQPINYQGVVLGDENSIVAITVVENRLEGSIYLGDGVIINLGEFDKPTSSATAEEDAEISMLPVESSEMPSDARLCSGDQPTPKEFQHSVAAVVANVSGGAGTGGGIQETLNKNMAVSKVVSIYFEADYSLFLAKGSVEATVAYINGLFNQVAALYQNEGIPLKISEVFVWTTPDPYAGLTSAESILYPFGSNRPSFKGDLAHFLTNRNIWGGVAYVGGLCNGARYGVSGIYNSYSGINLYSWPVYVIAHELGHNFGSRHTHHCSWQGGALDDCNPPEGTCSKGPTPTNGGTIMSYCHVVGTGINFANGFGPQPRQKIIDNINAATCLSPFNGEFKDLYIPTVSITSPSSMTVIKSGDSVQVNVNSSDNVGVSKVEFYVNNVLAGTDTIAPYAFNWDISKTVNGFYTLVAKAHDQNFNTNNSSVNIEIKKAVSASPDVLTLVKIYANQNLLAASSAEKNFAELQLLNTMLNPTTAKNLKFELKKSSVSTWSTVTATPTNNRMKIYASEFNTDYDVRVSCTNCPTSEMIQSKFKTFSEDIVLPNVYLTDPSQNFVYNNVTSVTLNAGATDNIAVNRVEFLANGQVLGSDLTSPYQFVWSLSSASSGSYKITARAFDKAGNSSTSSEIVVTINNGSSGPADTARPSVSLSSPLLNAVLKDLASFNLSATATDNIGVKKVDFLVNGSVIGSDTSSPYTFSWNLSTLAVGTYKIRARAVDTSGNEAETIENSVKIERSAVVDTSAPSISLTAPQKAITLVDKTSFLVTANSSDNVGVVSVDFLVNGSVLGTDFVPPYEWTWNVGGLASGTYSLSARAKDQAGNVKVSSVVSVTIEKTAPPVPDTTPPAIRMTNSLPDQLVFAWVPFMIEIEATDASGISNVEFFINNSTTPSCSFNTGINRCYFMVTRRSSSVPIKVVAKDLKNNSKTMTLNLSSK